MATAKACWTARIFLVVTTLPCAYGAASVWVDKFSSCRERTVNVLEGNQAYGDINNVTIWEHSYVYTGTIHGLDPHYSRANLVTLTFDGKHPERLIRK